MKEYKAQISVSGEIEISCNAKNPADAKKKLDSIKDDIKLSGYDHVDIGEVEDGGVTFEVDDIIDEKDESILD